MRKLFSLALALAPAVAAGQSTEPLRQPTSVPIELATALAAVGGFGRDEPQILVEAIPEWVAQRLYLPARARVIGSAFAGTTLVAIISVPGTAQSALDDLSSGLMQRGWTAPPSPGQRGGFRPASRAPTTTTTSPGAATSTTVIMPAQAQPLATTTLCGRDRQVLATGVRRERASDVTLFLRLSTTTTTGFSVCSPPSMRAGAEPQRDTMPTLYNPVGAQEMSGSMSSASCYEYGGLRSSTGTSARLRGVSPRELLEHYTRQLKDSGWTAVTGENGELSRTFARPDSARSRVQITIRTSQRDSTCSDISLNMEQRGRP